MEPRSPTLRVDSLPAEPQGKPTIKLAGKHICVPSKQRGKNQFFFKYFSKASGNDLNFLSPIIQWLWWYVKWGHLGAGRDFRDHFIQLSHFTAEKPEIQRDVTFFNPSAFSDAPPPSLVNSLIKCRHSPLDLKWRYSWYLRRARVHVWLCIWSLDYHHSWCMWAKIWGVLLANAVHNHHNF